MSNQLDLIGQYISQVLIPRLNHADMLHKKGFSYDAVQAQLSVIRSLYRRGEEDRAKLVEWEKQVDAIDEAAKMVKQIDGPMIEWQKNRIRNRMAVKIYRKIDWEIWDRLCNMGYFNMPKGSPFWDTSLGNKSGTKPPAKFPERMSSEIQ